MIGLSSCPPIRGQQGVAALVEAGARRCHAGAVSRWTGTLCTEVGRSERLGPLTRAPQVGRWLTSMEISVSTFLVGPSERLEVFERNQPRCLRIAPRWSDGSATTR